MARGHQRWYVVGRMPWTGMTHLQYISDHRWRWLALLAAEFYAVFGIVDPQVKNMWRP